ncbi:Hydrogenase-4 component A [Planctomycetes bacterium Pan216]|uniref:Hydrogenase-4 component A n=1 Tax=Kolteria novifilia TaxID=2527975 RepID=A0A518B7U3_9BACT|nr:Hydrogenase-4 component A [Planctomycetes bacterium Pan216]
MAVVMPVAELDPKEGDEHPDASVLPFFSLFQMLKKVPSFDKYPGTWVLRRYRPGDVVCEQGETGSTAFYILSTEDLHAFRNAQLESNPDDAELRAEVDALAKRIEMLAGLDGEIARDERHSAFAHLDTGNLRPEPRPEGIWDRIGAALFGSRRAAERPIPEFIPNDGPTDINAITGIAPMYEGEIFGESSCLGRVPRSATVIASRDCYMLEMVRSIMDKIVSDRNYQDKAEQKYKDRVFEIHLRREPLFSKLSSDQYKMVQSVAELIFIEPGDVLFDEFEKADSVYVIRRGTVAVIKGILLDRESIAPDRWKLLFQRVHRASAEPDDPRSLLWAWLSDSTRQAIEEGKASDVAVKSDMVGALNRLMTNVTYFGWSFLSEAGRADLLKGEESRTLTKEANTALHQFLQERGTYFHRLIDETITGEFPRADNGVIKVASMSPLQHRLLGRHLVASLFPEAVPQPTVPVTLAYRSRGECIGELGVIDDAPRTASCVAYDHPADFDRKIAEYKKYLASRVELVRIRRDDFQRILSHSPAVRAEVEKIAEGRRSNTETTAMRGWQAEMPSASPRYHELGFFQGQQLMLIDLDRCVRCGDCVSACKNTHDDGRTRLFLDGPRFENRYLSPATCRSCRDPVCMIGCPVGSITRGGNGEIIIENWCIGCKLCAEQCPYDSIQMHEILPSERRQQQEATSVSREVKEVSHRAVVCDLCSTLPTGPACVSMCPHDAARRLDGVTRF